ncbi:MAG TPA: EamA family transporter [Acidobacteriaceae bacterium]|nr:EamA family transporter [Acidobacteriaceae bacterium]
MKRILAYAAVYLFWGASFLAIKFVVHAVPPFLAAGIRFSIAGSILVLFSLSQRQPQPAGIEWRNLFLLAIILFVGDYALLFWIEQRLASGIAAVTAATIPAQVFLLEWLWLKRVRLTTLSATGLVLGLGGVTALVLPAKFVNGHDSLNRYALLGLLGASCWAFGTVLSTRLVLPKIRAVNAGWQMVFGGVALLALSALTGEWRHIHTRALTPPVWFGMAYLIVFASLIAFSAYVYLLQHEPARRVTSYAYVNPIAALLLGCWLGGESLTLRQDMACGVIIAGVIATLIGRQPDKPQRRV